jgi:ankyrin repeat protein
MMTPEDERCREAERFEKLDAAFREGDMAALRAAVADPEAIPNGPMPLSVGPCLEYAIYHSPLAFIRELLEIGADPNLDDQSGFPSMIAALSCHQIAGGSKQRTDVAEMITLLIAFGADPHQRGINDYTPLHMAASVNHPEAARILLEAGADPLLRTRIDEYETARELAEKAGHREIAAMLEQAERDLEST